jgi:flagellar hook protein FlgE
MTAVSAIALSGLNAAQATLRASAHNVANLATDGFRRQQVVASTAADGADGVVTQAVTADAAGHALEADVVAQLQAKHAFLANLAVFRAHDHMMGALLDARA